jgi:hypothetical protein
MLEKRRGRNVGALVALLAVVVFASADLPARACADFGADPPTTHFPGAGRGAEFAGDVLYMADAVDGVRVFQLVGSDPNLVGAAPVTGEPVDVAVNGDYLYVLTDIGMSIFDITDPLDPQAISDPAPGVSGGDELDLEGNWLWIADDHLRAYDISDPLHPAFVRATYDNHFTALDVSEGKVFGVTSRYDGPGWSYVRLEMFDVVPPNHPLFPEASLNLLDTGCLVANGTASAWAVSVRGGKAYVAAESFYPTAVYVVEVGVEDPPALVPGRCFAMSPGGKVAIPHVTDVLVDGNVAYLAWYPHDLPGVDGSIVAIETGGSSLTAVGDVAAPQPTAGLAANAGFLAHGADGALFVKRHCDPPVIDRASVSTFVEIDNSGPEPVFLRHVLWTTHQWTNPLLDEVTYWLAPGGAPQCDFGTVVHRGSDPGVTATVTRVFGGYEHEMVFAMPACVPKCSYEYDVASTRTGLETALEPPYPTFKVGLCPAR